MDQRSRKRERRKGNHQGRAPHAITVYLSTEDRAALKRTALKLQCSDSYTARLAIRDYCMKIAADDIESSREDAPLFRRMQQS